MIRSLRQCMNANIKSVLEASGRVSPLTLTSLHLPSLDTKEATANESNTNQPTVIIPVGYSYNSFLRNGCR